MNSLVSKLSPITTDIDIALSEFKEHFTESINIKFEVPFETEKVPMLQLALDEIVGRLRYNGWDCARNEHELNRPDKDKFDIHSGFVYGIKDSRDYGAAGFVYFNKKGKVIVDGSLFGYEKKDLNRIYDLMLDIFKKKFKGVKKLESENNLPWQTKEY